MIQNEQRKKQEMRTIKFFSMILCVMLSYVGFHMAIVHTETSNIGNDIVNGFKHLVDKPLVIIPSDGFNIYTLMYVGGIFLITGLFAMYFYYYSKRRLYDKGAAGTAEWNTNLKAYNKKYTSPFGKEDNSGYDNIILSQKVFLSQNGRKTRRNTHVFVIGGSGAGKSRFVVKPNVLQFNASFAITDPKGELLETLGSALEQNGYEIKVFNLSEMHKSMCYNPYAYIRDENGVRTMVKCIIDNTRGTDQNTGDPIWEDSMTALLQAISFYMIEVLPEKDRSFTTAMEFLRMAQIDENNTGQATKFDKLFEDLRAENPKSMAVMSYDTFRIGSGKTLKSILITTMTRLDVFNMTSVANLTTSDTIHLEEIGTKKCALFIIIPPANKTFNFITATLYSQLFETLYNQVDNICPLSWWYEKPNKMGGKEYYLTPKDKKRTKGEAKKLFSMLPESKVIKNEKTGRFDIYCKKHDTIIESFDSRKRAKEYLEEAKSAKLVRGYRSLPYNTRFLLDEFANIGTIPNFVPMLSTMRSYGISCTIIMQNLAQIQTMYEKEYGTVIGNCDSFLFLGAQEKETIEYVMEMLSEGEVVQKTDTISVKNNSEGRQTTGQNLMTFDQIRQMPDSDCILLIRGEKPFYGKKYEYMDHPNYKLTGDANPDNNYDNKFDNRKNKEEEQDQVKIRKEKTKLVKAAKNKLVSYEFNQIELFNKITGGDIKKLEQNATVETSSGDVAVTDEQKEEVKKRKKNNASGTSTKIDGAELNDVMEEGMGELSGFVDSSFRRGDEGLEP